MEQPYSDFIRVAMLLSCRKYTFAKTLSSNPHHYTVRKTWENDADFVFVVEQMRKYGWVGTFAGVEYTYYDCNGYTYWTMGAPIDLDGKPHTIIINRKRKHQIAEHRSEYDAIADEYENLFQEDSYHEQDLRMNALANIDLSGKRVLDIGCGTGLWVDLNPSADPKTYIGVDPALQMLRIFTKKHPDFRNSLVHEAFENFYLGKFDHIVSIYGGVSYLKPYAVERIPKMLNPGGTYFLVFFKDSYYPVTHEKLNVEPAIYRGNFNLVNAQRLIDFDEYIIATNLPE